MTKLEEGGTRQMANVYLGPAGSMSRLPNLMFMGSPPSWPVYSNKEVEVAKMSDKSKRVAFFGTKGEWGIALGFLTKVQLDDIRGLNELNQILDFQNNNEDDTIYRVFISAFRHEPERMDVRQLERYKVEMTLREV